MAKHDYDNAPILYVVDAKMYWRRIYEMDTDFCQHRQRVVEDMQ